MKVKYLLEGCGIAILVLLSYIWPQVSPNHVAIYLSVLPVTSITLGILIDVVALAAISTLVIALASRGDGDTNGRVVWVALIFVAISAAVSSIAKLTEVHTLTRNSAVLAGGVALPVCLTRYWSSLKYKVLVRGFRLVLALIGLCGIWIIPQLLFIALHRQSGDELAFRKPTSTNIPLRRIVWILFDELSYAQAFESRDSSLRLPNFDWLRDRSTSFSQLSPVGYYTARVVPSFLAGRFETCVARWMGGRESRLKNLRIGSNLILNRPFSPRRSAMAGPPEWWAGRILTAVCCRRYWTRATGFPTSSLPLISTSTCPPKDRRCRMRWRPLQARFGGSDTSLHRI
jgi:hypothetical protein